MIASAISGRRAFSVTVMPASAITVAMVVPHDPADSTATWFILLFLLQWCPASLAGGRQ
ncbi:hypothetical protein ACQEVY_05660 [Streptomyces sp. CA-288835]|uniref:hypothetical protein n=1 Tax=Streptomyces sp. CA-288835 TaxID=3240069 RepID=UPI003D8CE16E